jgi:hypothetical protein
VATTFDPEDYELRWPPQLFVDEAFRLLRRRSNPLGDFYDPPDNWVAEMEWLLTEAFVSSVPRLAFDRAQSIRSWEEGPGAENVEQWVTQLVEQAAHWPEPGTGKRYWSTRTGGRVHRTHMEFEEVVRAFVQLINEFKANGYLVLAFGQECIDDHRDPSPSAQEILSSRLGYPVEWPLETAEPDLDDLCDLIEVFHDLIARPSRRWHHEHPVAGTTPTLPEAPAVTYTDGGSIACWLPAHSAYDWRKKARISAASSGWSP